MKHRALLVIAFSALSALGATPVAAQDDDGDGGQPAPRPLVAIPEADPDSMLPDLENLAGQSIVAAGNDPDNGYSPLPVIKSFGPDGTTASVEANTRVTSGTLDSQIVVNHSKGRSVASVKANVCPDAGGNVSATVTMSIAEGDSERTIEATATGKADNSATLTSVKVRTAAKGAEAKLLEKVAKGVLRQAEQGWRGGLCVKIDVSEGQSRSVTPKEKVPISATAKQRFDGTEITGPMTSKLTSGKNNVKKPSVSTSPATFTYTGPDKKPGTGSVELKSVSKRGIGFVTLEYTTEADLKIDADHMGLWRLTTVKCGGPVGAWNIKGVIYEGEEPFGNEQIVFSLPKSLSSTWTSTGVVGGAGYTRPVNESGSVTYTEAKDGKSGTLNLAPGGSVPVTFGTFCKDGVPPPG